MRRFIEQMNYQVEQISPHLAGQFCREITNDLPEWYTELI